MGTPDFAVTILEALVASKEEVAGVVTQPDRPRGRGLKVIFSPVKEFALQNNLKVLQPANLKDPAALGKIKEMAPELIVTAAYGKILPKTLLDLPRYGAVNVHFSLLPKYRGASPVAHALLHGDKETGVTIFQMDAGLDTGDILLQEKLSINEEDNAGTLTQRLALLGAKLIPRLLKDIGTLPRIKQNEAMATYAPLLKKDDGRIKWDRPAEEIYNLVRAMNPWPGAYTAVNNKTVKIIKTRLEGEKLQIMVVQSEGKKPMAYKDYLRGHPPIITE